MKMGNSYRNIIIIGFKTCGKSTVGKAVAERAGLEFVDSDQALEEQHKRKTGQAESFREIYRKMGKEYFRNLEREVLNDIVKDREGVIALGGGSLTEAPDPEGLLKGSFCVYLSVEPETLFSRIMSGGMPAFFNREDPKVAFRELYEQRLPHYRRLADIMVDNTDRSVDAVVDEILEEFENRRSGVNRGQS